MAHQRLSSKDRSQHLRILISNFACCLCMDKDGRHSHLLLQCSFSTEIRGAVSQQKFGVDYVIG